MYVLFLVASYICLMVKIANNIAVRTCLSSLGSSILADHVLAKSDLGVCVVAGLPTWAAGLALFPRGRVVVFYVYPYTISILTGD